MKSLSQLFPNLSLLCVCVQTYETTFIREIERKHAQAQRHFSQMSAMTKYLDSQPAAHLGNQLQSKPITMAIVKHASATTQSSDH